MSRIVTDPPARGHFITSQARWGAILAGVIVALALLCFLHLFGLAIGVSVIDWTDAAVVGEGLGIGIIIWSIISWLAALFLGSMHTARLSGEANETVGLLNGVTVWATTSVIVTALSVTGAASAISGAFSIAGTAVSSSASAVGSVASASGSTLGSAVTQLTQADSPVTDEVSAILKQQASDAIADTTGESGPTAQEIRRSIDQIDAETIRSFANHLVDGDTEAAADALADDIALSERDLNRIAEAVSRELQQMIGTADNNQPLGQDVLDRAKSSIASALQNFDRAGPPNVSQDDIRAALDDLDPAVMQTIAWRLVRGNADGARNALVANTALTREESDELISGVEAEIDQAVNRFREQAEEYADEAGDYAQGLVWTAFLIATLSLASSAIGGWLGTRPITRRTAVRPA